MYDGEQLAFRGDVVVSSESGGRFGSLSKFVRVLDRMGRGLDGNRITGR